ncbi:hypothetical protein BH11PLA2_BH11PLA2_21840 [soil metagenome]
MKNTNLAFVLSFFFPGAGLYYLGWRGCALINLLLVLSIGIIAALLMSEDAFARNIGAIGAGCGGGSGGLAMALAKQHNLKSKERKDSRNN